MSELCQCSEFHTEKDDADETMVDEMDCRCDCHRQLSEKMAFQRHLSLARAVIEALPRCCKCEKKAEWVTTAVQSKATSEPIFYCREHAIPGVRIWIALPYRAALLAYLGDGR